MADLKNPFIYGRIVEVPHFVNRRQEIERLTGNFRSGQNTIIISPRRWGKSSLVNQAVNELMKQDKTYLFCSLDLFNVRTEQEFYENYVREILKASSVKWEDWLDSAKKFLKSIVPRFSFGINPEQEFSVSFDLPHSARHVSEILSLAENIGQAKRKKFIVCIDEFQNLTHYKHPLAFQKKLRATWQKHTQAVYCLYGSKRHMITDIFENKSMPFYKFGDVLFLQKIAAQHWVSSIVSAFRKSGKVISEENAGQIPMIAKDHPYYVQQLAQKVWSLTSETATAQTIAKATEDLLHENSILYLREIENLSNTQVNFLKAVCENVQRLSAAETLRQYKLGTSANVLRIKSALQEKELLDLIGPYPEILDPLFERWLKAFYFNIKTS